MPPRVPAPRPRVGRPCAAAPRRLLLAASGALAAAALDPLRELDKVEPSKITCLLPVGEGELLTESEVWQRLLHAGFTEVRNRKGEATAALTDALMHDLDETTAAAVHDSGLPHISGLPRVPAGVGADEKIGTINFLLRRADREAGEWCASDAAHAAWAFDALRTLHSELGRAARGGARRLGPAANDTWGFGEEALSAMPLLNEGEECWEECGSELEGPCRTGFCGRGLCCMRGATSLRCPVGPNKGCVGKHCCVEDPELPYRDRRSHCNAAPGSFCLSSLARGADLAELSAVERCALQRSNAPCPPGFSCKGGQSPPFTCRGGMYCPYGSRGLDLCPEGYFCPLTFARRRCPAGFVCVAGSMMPQLCPDGSYCAEASGIAVICPEGHFCGKGASSPARCPLWATCREGSALPAWRAPPKIGLLAVSLAFALGLRAVPEWLRGSKSAWRLVPTAGVASGLALGWVVALDAPALAAQLFVTAPEDAAEWSVSRLVGGMPHTKALLFLTLTYSHLLYGLLVSSRFSSRRACVAADVCVSAGACVAFAACLNDAASLVFMCCLALAFSVVCVLLVKWGPLEFRVGLLGVGLLAVAAGLHLLDCSELAACMALALFAVLLRELVQACFGRMRRLVARRRIIHAGSVLQDTLLPPLLIDSLSADAFDTRASVQEIVTAACVAAGARACLAEQQAASVASARLSKAMDPRAWAPWGPGGAAGGRQGAGVSFELEAVNYLVGPTRTLLKDLSFSVPAGSAVAVMGASGSGKTTLLSVLSGRCGDGRFRGRLSLNGESLQPWQMAELRPLVGYVPQDDTMHTSLTVRENVEFQARLRLPAPAPGAAEGGGAVAERAAAVIRDLGLAATADRVVKDGLSGGQRKRVSIGMEVVTKPRVLLLDEPTTGLDSATAHRIVEVVLDNARKDECTSFATIHQPRWGTVGLFDMLVLLAPGGHLCYAGPVSTSKAYFEDVLCVEFVEDENPADRIMDTCIFDSARRMALDGTWKNPPQCLRAVLFPTPEAANAEDKESGPWQADEFGRMLATLWSDFAELRLRLAGGAAADEAPRPVGPLPTAAPSAPWRAAPAPFDGTEAAEGGGHVRPWRQLEAEVGQRTDTARWGHQVWLHLSRSLLIDSRETQTLAFHVVLLALAMVTLGVSIPDARFFLKTGLLILLLALVQSVAAQRLFGGEERHVAWREASVSSLIQVVFAFVGKDIASLMEITLTSFVFVFAYWDYAGTYASAFDMYEVGFATTYAFWGFNHVLAICFPPSAAMLLSVVFSFMSFLMSGLRPPAAQIMPALHGYGKLVLLASPVRWALTNWLFHHVASGAALTLSPVAKAVAEQRFRERGFSLEDLPMPPNRSINERWSQGSGWVSSSGQLFLLGFLFRFLAVTLLLFTSSANASGGQLSLGEMSMAKSRVMKGCLVIFLTFFSAMCIALLGRTW